LCESRRERRGDGGDESTQVGDDGFTSAAIIVMAEPCH
jgi:hypothetical protein